MAQHVPLGLEEVALAAGGEQEESSDEEAMPALPQPSTGFRINLAGVRAQQPESDDSKPLAVPHTPKAAVMAQLAAAAPTVPSLKLSSTLPPPTAPAPPSGGADAAQIAALRAVLAAHAAASAAQPDEVFSSSSDEDEAAAPAPPAPPGGIGFKLNLAAMPRSTVDDRPDGAVPPTPKEEVMARLRVESESNASCASSQP